MFTFDNGLSKYSTHDNPFNNELYNLRGPIRAKMLTPEGMIVLPRSVRTYFFCLGAVRTWRDKVIDYADIKPVVKIIYLKLGALSVVTAFLALLRLLGVLKVINFVGFAAIITYINAVILALFGFAVWTQYIRTIFNGEDKGSNIWLVTTT